MDDEMKNALRKAGATVPLSLPRLPATPEGEAWRAVVEVLTRVSPGWMARNVRASAQELAVMAIEELAVLAGANREKTITEIAGLTPDKVIRLTPVEVQSAYTRQQWAEGLILQLPKGHDGRNSWLMNFGTGDEAKAMRARRGLDWIEETQSAATIKGGLGSTSP